MSAGYLRENQTLASNAAQVAYGAVGHGRDAADARARRLAGLLVAGKQSPRARASAGLLPVTQQTRGLVGWLVWHLAWLEPPTTTTCPPRARATYARAHAHKCSHAPVRWPAETRARARLLAHTGLHTLVACQCVHAPAVCAGACTHWLLARTGRLRRRGRGFGPASAQRQVRACGVGACREHLSRLVARGPGGLSLSRAEERVRGQGCGRNSA